MSANIVENNTIATYALHSFTVSPVITATIDLTTITGDPVTPITIYLSNLTLPDGINATFTLTNPPTVPPEAAPTTTTTSNTGSSNSSITTTPTSSLSPEKTTECPTGGTSAGKAAGIGIGSAIAAAVLFALLAAAYFWRRRKSSRSRHHIPHKGQFMLGPTAQAESSSLFSGHTQEKLPQPITRDDIAREASHLEGAIRNYVENFTDCQSSSKRHYEGLEIDASDLGEYSQYHIQWATLLQNGSKRYDALRMFIARVLAVRTSATGAPSSTLLPVEILQTYQQIVAGREKDHHMQNLWRTMTAHLLSTTYSTSTTPLRSSDPRSNALENTVAIIMKALEPFRLRHRGSDTREHEMLIELVAKAALLGLRLFMQTAPTELFWSDTSSHGGHVSQVSQNMEVFPGVRQWTGSKGSRPDIIRRITTQ